MKKSELVQALLVVLGTLVAAGAEAEPSLILGTPEGTIRAGDVVPYAVAVTGARGCAGLTFDFSYDPGDLDMFPLTLAPVLTAGRIVTSTKKRTPGALAIQLAWGEGIPSDGDTLALCSIACQALDSDPAAPGVTLRRALSATGPSLASSRPGAREPASTTVTRFALGQNRPNPFNPETVISFELPVAAPVTITVYHVSGRRIGTMVDYQMFAPGDHAVRWDGKDDLGNAVPAGLYFCRIEASGWASTMKMVVVR